MCVGRGYCVRKKEILCVFPWISAGVCARVCVFERLSRKGGIF